MAAKTATYGIAIPNAQIVLILSANNDSAVAHDYGCEFRPVMAAICKLFGHKYVHTATSLKAIIKELGSANGIRNMRQALSPSNLLDSNGTANAVDDVDDRVA